MEYDVIIIGARPVGCSAGKVAAERGLKTIILEEHRAIGIPRHCHEYSQSNLSEC